MNRRRFLRGSLTISAMAAVAGCTGSADEDNPGGSSGGGGDGGSNEPPDEDNDGVPDSRDDFPRDSSRSELVNRISDRDELNEDYYLSYDFSLSEPAVLDYTVEVDGDVRIDVIVTDRTNLSYFEDGSDWKYVSELSDLETTHASARGGLDSGEWVIIVDNTSKGVASPPMNFDNDRVGFSIEGEIYR